MARDFNGVNQTMVATPTTGANLRFGDEPLTICGRFLFDTLASDQTLAGIWDVPDNERSYALRFDALAGRLQFAVSADGTAETSVSADSFGMPATGVWLPVIGWHDPTTNQIGVNVAGSEDTAAHAGGIASFADTVFFLGARRGGDWFDGGGAEVAVFTSVLSAEQRAAYVAGDAPTMIDADSLLTYWKLLRGENVPDEGAQGGAATDWTGLCNLLYPTGGTAGIRFGHPPMIYPGGIRTTIFEPATITSDAPAYVAAILGQPSRPRRVQSRRRRSNEFAPPYVEESQGGVLVDSPPPRRPKRAKVRRRPAEFAPTWPPIPGVIDVCGGTAHLVTRRAGTAKLLSASVGGAAATNGTAALIFATPGTAKRVEC